MKTIKRIFSVALCLALVGTMFAGCSSSSKEKYSDETLIIGYTDAVAPFLEVDENGDATGFCPDLFEAIFDDVKGDYKSYVFEKVEDGYTLEEDGGFTDSDGNEYSAELIMGAVSKNNGTFNEDYSFTEPVITDRVIAVSPIGSKVATFANFKGAKVVTVSDVAKDAFNEQTTIALSCESISEAESVEAAFKMIEDGDADVLITDEFNYMTAENTESYNILDGEIDVIDYVIACAKYSSWKDSINEAIRELKSEDYGKNGDEFTPIVEKYFGYNASSFEYETDGDK